MWCESEVYLQIVGFEIGRANDMRQSKRPNQYILCGRRIHSSGKLSKHTKSHLQRFQLLRNEITEASVDRSSAERMRAAANRKSFSARARSWSKSALCNSCQKL